jgi:ribosomal protein S6--L-glutamate ligase
VKIAVIEYRSTPPKSALELIEAIERKNHTPVYLKAHILDAVIKGRDVLVYHGRDEVSVDSAILRNIGFFLSLEVFMKRLGVLEALAQKIPVINDPSASFIARDKWRCLLRLHAHGIPVPETLITENPFSAMRFVTSKKRAVLKPIMGSLGLGSTLISDPDTAFTISRSLKNTGIPSYYQVYLEKPGYDYRAFVVGDQVIGAMKRVSSYWKTNIAQGAQGVAVRAEDEPEVYELALKATKILGLEYAGVDIAYDTSTQKYFILEVNAFPHWEGLRRATGTNPPDYIVDYIINKTKR